MFIKKKKERKKHVLHHISYPIFPRTHQRVHWIFVFANKLFLKSLFHFFSHVFCVFLFFLLFPVFVCWSIVEKVQNSAKFYASGNPKYFFFPKNLSLLIVKAIFFLLRFPLHIKISSCMCKRKFLDSFSAYVRLDFGK